MTILLVDDDEDDYLITRDLLERQDRVRFSIDWCKDYSSALEAIANQAHDVYLIDYRLGEYTGLDLVRAGFADRPAAPVIMLTGQADYEIDLEATALGVTDFLLKQDLNPLSLERSIRYAISHQRALSDLARSEERYALAARAVNDGIWDWDLIADRVYFSERFHELLGHVNLQEEHGPDTWFALVHEDDLPELQAAIAAHLEGRTGYLQAELRMQHADGTWRWVLARGLASRSAAGVPTRMAGSLSDVTERRRVEQQLQHDALHDALTGLPNRALFTDLLAHALRRARRDESLGCAVLFLDIDRFKLVNDSFSHAIGDRLLEVCAARIAGVLRPGDTVARLGGDEFTVLIEDVTTDPVASALHVAERIQATLSEGFVIEEHQLSVTASIGIAVGSPDLRAPDLLRNADIAMYEAKRTARGAFAVFDVSMHRKVTDRLSHETALRQALDEGLLEVHYQPVVDLGTGHIHGFEALARWPSGWAPVSPTDFVPIAEETGLIGPLGLHVLRSALSALSDWRTRGLISPDVRMSVNVSAGQLDDNGFPESVLEALADNDVPAHLLRLEITEGTLMREPMRMTRIVTDLCTEGVGLELDDFGTGYSSLAALRQFPVNALKIDRSFVANLTTDVDSEVIVRSTVALGHSLGLSVIAEGIEHMGQMDRLRSLGCDHAQGYLFSRPVPAEAVESLVRNWSPLRVRHSGVEDSSTWASSHAEFERSVLPDGSDVN